MIKGLTVDGPILFQARDDLPPMARPFTTQEKEKIKALGARWGQLEIEDSAPITFIGTAKNLNDATENALQRAAKTTGLSYDEIMNRCTITGSIEISRLPGMVRATFLCPMPILETLGIADLVREHYAL